MGENKSTLRKDMFTAKARFMKGRLAAHICETCCAYKYVKTGRKVDGKLCECSSFIRDDGPWERHHICTSVNPVKLRGPTCTPAIDATAANASQSMWGFISHLGEKNV